MHVCVRKCLSADISGLACSHPYQEFKNLSGVKCYSYEGEHSRGAFPPGGPSPPGPTPPSPQVRGGVLQSHTAVLPVSPIPSPGSELNSEKSEPCRVPTQSQISVIAIHPPLKTRFSSILDKNTKLKILFYLKKKFPHDHRFKHRAFLHFGRLEQVDGKLGYICNNCQLI